MSLYCYFIQRTKWIKDNHNPNNGTASLFSLLFYFLSRNLIWREYFGNVLLNTEIEKDFCPDRQTASEHEEQVPVGLIHQRQIGLSGKRKRREIYLIRNFQGIPNPRLFQLILYSDMFDFYWSLLLKDRKSVSASIPFLNSSPEDSIYKSHAVLNSTRHFF